MRYSAKSLPGFQVESLTVPLRCTPVVQREVELAMEKMEKMERVSGLPLRYTTNTIPAACDGPGIIRILHKEHDHQGQNPADCYQCGQNIAHVLHHQLQVGQSGTQMSQMFSLNLITTARIREEKCNLKNFVI